MNITTRALHLADAAAALAKVSTTRADDIKLYDEALTVIREALVEHEKQEPVAWMDFHGNVKNNEEINDYIAAGWGKDKAATYSISLYTAPVSAKREWVNPTPQDVYGLVREGAAGGGWQGFASRLSAWLKEKNNG